MRDGIWTKTMRTNNEMNVHGERQEH